MWNTWNINGLCYGIKRKGMKMAKEKEKCCATCKYHQFESFDNGFVCANGESEYVAEWTESKFCCIDYEERE